MPAQREWKRQADVLMLRQKQKPMEQSPALLSLRSPSAHRADLIWTTAVKILIDAVRGYGLVPDDSRKYMRKLTVQFGDAPSGARLTLIPLSSCVV
jgi:hypothetical protein